MLTAVEKARKFGGKLHRHPGGFWQGPKFEQWEWNAGTRTVQALVDRGVAEYTEWKEGRSGRFPIEMTLKD